MEMALTYSSDDNEVKYYKTTKLNGVSVKISACTISGSSSGIDDRLNEDAFSLIINKGVLTAAVFDGCSIEGNFDWLYTTPARYASHYSKHALEKILGNTESEKLLMSVNDKLLKKSLKLSSKQTLDTSNLPSTTATIVQFNTKTNKMFLSNLGDSFCIVFYKNGASSLLSIDKNKPYEDKINRAIKQIAQEANTTVREIIGSSRVNKLFKDRAIYTHNQTDGSGQGILNGDYRAQQYIQNEYIATDKIESVLIATDGLLPPGIKKDKIKDRQKIAKWLKSGGLERVIAIKKCTEDADPDWNYVRTKHSDDATGVYLEFLVQ